MKYATLSITMLLWLCTSLSTSLSHEQIAASELLEAPIILIGQVQQLSKVGSSVLQRGGPINVEVLSATIEVQQLLRGDISTNQVVLGNLRNPVNPSTYIGRPLLEPGKTYVFFLSHSGFGGELAAVNADEYAIEIESEPGTHTLNEPPSQRLKSIAKANIAKASDVVAARWFDFLGNQYDSAEDYQFCVDKTTDTRLSIRGSAVAVLCENCGASSPLIYSKAVQFLKDASEIEGLWPWRRRISVSLPRTLGENGLTTDILVDWIRSDVRELQEVALAMLPENPDASLGREISGLMLRTKSRRMQYDCVKALSVIKSVSGPSYKEFMKTPDKYVDEWKIREH